VRLKTDIVAGLAGQAVSYRVIEGRPSAASFQVFRDTIDDVGEAELAGSASIDTVNTITTAAAGPSEADPHRLSVFSAAGFTAGRKYLVIGAQQREWVEVVEVQLGYVRARHPLKNSYATGATIVGTTITASIDVEWSGADEHLSDLTDPFPDYRIRWAYTVDGAAGVAWSYFDVVRAVVRHQVDIADIAGRLPGFHDALPVDLRQDQGRLLIDSAWRAVRADFQSVSMDVAAVRDDEVLDELVILRALVVVAEAGWHPPAIDAATFIDLKQRGYDRFWEQHFKATLKHPVSTGTGADSHRAQARPIWRK
jgi:hypothetical protein